MRTHRLVVLLALIAAGVAATAAGVRAAGIQRAGTPPDRAVPQGERPAEHLDLASSGCLTCHSTAAIEERGAGLRIDTAVLGASVHGGLGCTSCHAELGASIHPDPAAERRFARASCAGCHEPEAAAFAKGAHAGAVTSGRPEPGCVTCHGAHAVLPAGSRAFVATAAEICSGCHTERGESFFDGNYHGKETSFGRHDVAVCSDCHGAHMVLPASDPRSSVAPANVLATCRQCHESAPPNFAGIVIHVNGAPLPTDPRLRMVTLYMTLLLVVTFGLFGAHSALSLRQAWRKRRGVIA